MENAEVHFILFVNTKSGDGQGAALLDLGGNQITIRYESNHTAKLHIFDLFHLPSRTDGLSLALSFSQQQGIDYRVVICGGDGTIPWVLSELYEAGMDLSQVVIGILPIGTGNDFSRSLGWGASGPKISRAQLRGLGDLVK